jgi:hypothetical protein
MPFLTDGPPEQNIFQILLLKSLKVFEEWSRFQRKRGKGAAMWAVAQY